jgi:hypothetical protein
MNMLEFEKTLKEDIILRSISVENYPKTIVVYFRGKKIIDTNVEEYAFVTSPFVPNFLNSKNYFIIEMCHFHLHKNSKILKYMAKLKIFI